MKALRQKRYLINIVLSAIAVGVMVLYLSNICANSCSYLKGSIFGIDLQYIGIAYMAVLICLNLLRKDLFIIVLLSAGTGVEAFLVGFQVIHATYCPFCLVFGAIVLMQFVLNFDWKRKWFIVSSMIIGFTLFAIIFRGTAFPTYALKIAMSCA